VNVPEEALSAKALADGRCSYVIPILFGRAYVTVAGEDSDRMGVYDEVYTYETVAAALAALGRWDGEQGTEPDGWIRHQPSNRRREFGDPEREEVRD
jgi:hypothetical protein